MGVAQRNCEGIGSIGLKRFTKPQQHTHHMLDLILISPTRTNDRQFDLAWTVFRDL
jgi:hypothetical protein